MTGIVIAAGSGGPSPGQSDLPDLARRQEVKAQRKLVLWVDVRPYLGSMRVYIDRRAGSPEVGPIQSLRGGPRLHSEVGNLVSAAVA